MSGTTIIPRQPMPKTVVFDRAAQLRELKARRKQAVDDLITLSQKGVLAGIKYAGVVAALERQVPDRAQLFVRERQIGNIASLPGIINGARKIIAKKIDDCDAVIQALEAS